MVLCWATFLVLLGHMFPKGLGWTHLREEAFGAGMLWKQRHNDAVLFLAHCSRSGLSSLSSLSVGNQVASWSRGQRDFGLVWFSKGEAGSSLRLWKFSVTIVAKPRGLPCSAKV